MQTTNPTPPGGKTRWITGRPPVAPVCLFPETLRDGYVQPAQRHFIVDVECDGIPWRFHVSAAHSTEATQRARYRSNAVPGFNDARTVVTACVEVGPA